MPDDTVYAGVSKTTGEQMFIAVPGGKGQGSPLTFNEAQEALKNLAEHGPSLPFANEGRAARIDARF
jgi:hypothetical protein